MAGGVGGDEVVGLGEKEWRVQVEGKGGKRESSRVGRINACALPWQPWHACVLPCMREWVGELQLRWGRLG